MNLETAIDELAKNRYFIWDDFLSADEVNTVMLDYRKLHADGQFTRAGVGKKKSTEENSPIHEEVRHDEIHWLDPLVLTPGQHLFWDRLECLKNGINEQAMLGLWSLEGHYSHYFENGFYKPHLDRFASDDTRTISMVLYLNPDWKVTDGGELRIHSSDTSSIDVLPAAGRLVCFLSESILHEVRVAHRDRFSFAGWWKRRPQN
jgi:SM-20-related protein